MDWRTAAIDQPLDWPRVAIRPSERCNASYPYGTYYGSGLYTGAGLWIPSNTIPQAVKNAQFEFAFATQGSAAMSSAEKYKRKIITDANGTLEFNVGAENVASLNSLAMRELRGLLLTSAGVKLTAGLDKMSLASEIVAEFEGMFFGLLRRDCAGRSKHHL